MKTHESIQIPFNGFVIDNPTFPQTRYQGSKLKLINWIEQSLSNLEYHSVLDAFGGTGVVSYMFKKKGKKVVYNDFLNFNYQIGLALIENSRTTLSNNDLEFLLKKHSHINYPTFVYDNFSDVFFTDDENAWIDYIVRNIELLGEKNKYKKALAFFALYQSAIIKRPYNLFHRKNLYMRTAEVKRNFGNKATWDKPFEECFKNFVYQANRAVFHNGFKCRSICFDVEKVGGKYDLVYIDPPYVSPRGTGLDYLEFYNFLEGLTNYHDWGDRINYKTKHRSLIHSKDDWTDKNKIAEAFDRVFYKFKDSILVVSYRDPGVPSHEELVYILKKYKKSVIDVNHTKYKYVLSNNDSSELLIIAK